jgi:phage tail P2-like protein
MTRLLPPNATPFERALERVTERVTAVPRPLSELWNPWTCPIDQLPWLAWALSIDDWSADWPEQVKRTRVAIAIAVQRRKGTAKSVRDIVRAYGGSLVIREWWETEPKGEPHTFSLIIFGGRATTVDAIIRDVERTKPLRSHFTFTQAIESDGAIGVVGAALPILARRLNLAAPAA